MNLKASSLHVRVHSVDRMVESACNRWEAGHKELPSGSPSQHMPPALTIAIHREAGTQGTQVAHEVGKKLGWQVYDHELLDEIAEQMGVDTTAIESMDERQISWLRESIEAFFFTSDDRMWVSHWRYVRRLVKTVLALGMHGHCVIVGRGAPFILPAETTLRVQLMAPLKERVATLSRTQGIPLDEATRQVRHIDQQCDAFVKGHFFRDPTDPRHYDLALNSGRMTIDAEADLIIDALRHWESRPSLAARPSA